MVHTDDLRQTADNAEHELNSYQAKQGLGRKGNSTLESGVDETVSRRFPGSTVKYGPGSTASGSDHRPIPEDEGGTRDDRGRLAKGEQYLGVGGPEDKIRMAADWVRPGDRDILSQQEKKRRGMTD